MKKVILMLILLLAVACSPAKDYVCPDCKVVGNPELCKKAEPVKAESITENTNTPDSTTAETSISSDVAELLAKSSKVKSMSYVYKETSLRTSPLYMIQFKDNLVKVGLPITANILNANEIDTVILNQDTQEAQAYCESLSYCIKQGRQENVDFAQYYKPTPLDLLKKISSAKKVGEERIFNRDTWKLDVNSDYYYWIDEFYGIPLKVEGNGEYYSFESAFYNQVKTIEFVDRE